MDIDSAEDWQQNENSVLLGRMAHSIGVSYGIDVDAYEMTFNRFQDKYFGKEGLDPSEIIPVLAADRSWALNLARNLRTFAHQQPAHSEVSLPPAVHTIEKIFWEAPGSITSGHHLKREDVIAMIRFLKEMLYGSLHAAKAAQPSSISAQLPSGI